MVCERLCADHAAELPALLLDPRVARTLWARVTPATEADVITGLEAMIAHWEWHGFGMWLLRDRRTGAMIGRGGLQYTYVADFDAVEAGWAIIPARWGEGLATELALACVKVASNDLQLRELVAFTLPDNIASRRVMEKASFVYEREVTHAGLPHVLYRRRLDGP
jgi:RimJ/RimL family protein N-acetyltransferase